MGAVHLGVFYRSASSGVCGVTGFLDLLRPREAEGSLAGTPKCGGAPAEAVGSPPGPADPREAPETQAARSRPGSSGAARFGGSADG